MFFVKVIQDAPEFLEYLPHAISGLSILATIIITVCQNKANVKLYEKNSNFDVKKEAILEAMNFIDTYISFLDFESGVVPVRDEKTTEQSLTIHGRTVYNKLCLTCDNKTIIDTYLNIILPKKSPSPVFDLYNTFRNECRKELGFSEIDLPKDEIYISRVTTRELSRMRSKESNIESSKEQ